METGDGTRNCPHRELPELAVIPMAVEMPGYRELVRLKDRGSPYWWLWLGECSECSQHWLVAQEERLHDNVIMRRLSDREVGLIVEQDAWPDDFDRYETLLEIGIEHGRLFYYLDPTEQLPHIVDLARERPGISVTDLARLLNIDPDVARDLAVRARRESGVDITLD
jgi:hypothetical protein